MGKVFWVAIPVVLVSVLLFTARSIGQDKTASPSYKIVFVSDRDGNNEICLMDVDGSNVKRLTNNAGNDISPAPSPDGRKIVFVSDQNGNSEIYIMDADGTNQKNLTNNGATDGSPVWAPDGKKICFISDRDGNNEIYVMDSDGSNQKNLSNNRENDFLSAWSPDGKKISFKRDTKLYTMNADGSNQKELTANTNAFSPTWSPDGRKIAFISDKEGNCDVYTINADGSGEKKLTPYKDQNTKDRAYFKLSAIPPAWSPDGKKIVFGYSPIASLDNAELTIINVDGSNEKRLTKIELASGTGIGVILSRSGDEGVVEWSPNGRKIMFVSVDSEIYTIDPNGSNEKNITNNEAFDSFPAWLPTVAESKK